MSANSPSWFRPLRQLLMSCFLILVTGTLAVAYTPLSVEDIYTRADFLGRSLQDVHWRADGKELVYLTTTTDTHERVLMAAAPSDGRTRVLLRIQELQNKSSNLTSITRHGGEDPAGPECFCFAPDDSRMLYLFKGDIYEYHFVTGTIRRWTSTPEEESDVRYSPGGERISFVRNCNVFIIDIQSSREIQVTTDGSRELTFGTTDWVLQEEFDLDRGYWWAPDGNSLVIMRLDESHVPDYPLVDWLPQHPQTVFEKYPKAGDPNPEASFYLYDLQEATLRRLPITGLEDAYVPRLQWTPDSRHLLLQILNREQNHLRLLRLTPKTDEIRTILEEKAACWINITNLLYLFHSRNELLWGSERSGFMHLYRYTLDGQLLGQVTRGNWMVTALNGVDESNRKVYFTSTEKSPLERHLYEIALQGGNATRLTRTEGTHVTTLASGCQAFLDQYTDTATPPEYRLGLMSHRDQATLIERTPPALYQPFDFQAVNFSELKAPDGTVLHTMMIKPHNFDPTRKYPVLIYVYGGPHAQVVTRDWHSTYFLWHQLLAQRGFIIFSLDNRGSYGRGKAWETAIYRNLGHQELLDQMVGVEYLKTLPWVDSGRIGIWGWSYGGYMTCYALTHEFGVFRAGAAVAPVVNWLNYDSVYTERYMNLPRANPDGYRRSAPVNRAGNLESPFLLVHGTADDNVHLQNSIQMINALINHNKKFRFMLYPGKKHGIHGRDARIHLFELLTDFFQSQLGR